MKSAGLTKPAKYVKKMQGCIFFRISGVKIGHQKQVFFLSFWYFNPTYITSGGKKIFQKGGNLFSRGNKPSWEKILLRLIISTLSVGWLLVVYPPSTKHLLPTIIEACLFLQKLRVKKWNFCSINQSINHSYNSHFKLEINIKNQDWDIELQHVIDALKIIFFCWFWYSFISNVRFFLSLLNLKPSYYLDLKIPPPPH